MSDLLHSVHALRDLAASTPEPARSWAAATARLWGGVQAPWPTVRHPLARWGWAPLLRRHPRLPAAPDRPGAGLAEGVLLAERLGVPIHGEWGEPLRASLEQAAPADRPALALALARVGALEPQDLRRAAPHADRASLAALVIPLASSRGEGPATARQALEPLTDAERSTTLELLGAPRILAGSTEPDVVVHQVAEQLGVLRPDAPAVRGSRARRALAWATALLSGRDTAVAHALGAVVTSTRDTRTRADAVAAAAWLALFEPSADPVLDVLERGGAQHGPTLAAARARPAPPLASDPPLPDGALLLIDDPARALPAAFAARMDLAPAFLVDDATPLGAALSDPEHRTGALVASAWCPTLDVLQMLLDLPVPHDAFERRALGWALACMGDPLAARHVRALVQADASTDHSAAVALIDGLGL